MARTCTVCTSDHRAEIDEAIVGQVSLRDIARRFGVSKDAVLRHRESHLSPALTSVHRQRQHEHAETLTDRMEALYRRIEAILDRTERGGRDHLSLGAARELRATAELLGKLTGELDDRPKQIVNVLVSSEWHQVRAAVFSALDAYPEARAAVAGHLLELEPGERAG